MRDERRQTRSGTFHLHEATTSGRTCPSRNRMTCKSLGTSYKCQLVTDIIYPRRRLYQISSLRIHHLLLILQWRRQHPTYTRCQNVQKLLSGLRRSKMSSTTGTSGGLSSTKASHKHHHLRNLQRRRQVPIRRKSQNSQTPLLCPRCRKMAPRTSGNVSRIPA